MAIERADVRTVIVKDNIPVLLLTLPIFAMFSSLNCKITKCLKKKVEYQQLQFIDSESVADPEHPAYGIVEQLNEQITHYDIVLATPTIGTGVSIDVQGHFKAVFGINFNTLQILKI